MCPAETSNALLSPPHVRLSKVDVSVSPVMVGHVAIQRTQRQNYPTIQKSHYHYRNSRNAASGVVCSGRQGETKGGRLQERASEAE
jgi:hypothetical protein